ncbi:Tight adherence secretin (plasmid) [Sodalis praecaptivus]|uniref:Tight adherence secretin n=1 Tax=Sodalis praecaptivus TaxID=1239307 RepID=W0HZ33_9GAMM|nr:pilus assembly protein N-terminal domain-containing protein [Sodalis praecaptivus]AHF79111.1 Tight adherence secretin [Sodalis praecaptivus]
MPIYKKQTSRHPLGCLIAIGVWIFISSISYAGAAETYLAPGDTRVIQVPQAVDTIFISSPDIVDYKLVGQNNIITYAKKAGRGDLIAFDIQGKQILKTTLVVDQLLSELHNRISKEFPDTYVHLSKIGDTYIISGEVNTEDAYDRVNQIVANTHGAEKTINKLHKPLTNQINVKLSVVEVKRSLNEQLGIDWKTLTGLNGMSDKTSAVPIFKKFNAESIIKLVQAIKDENMARILAEPNLTVLSGETAEFLVGGEIPIVTSSNNGSTVTYKSYGIKLKVGAKARDSQHIRVTLNEEVSSLSKDYVAGTATTLPGLTTRQAKTTVELADGESFLLAGLISNEEMQSMSQLPFIGDVPILGPLFRVANTEQERKELVVVATVNLVQPSFSHHVPLPNLKRSPTWARFLNLSKVADENDRKRVQAFIEKGGFIE